MLPFSNPSDEESPRTTLHIQFFLHAYYMKLYCHCQDPWQMLQRSTNDDSGLIHALSDFFQPPLESLATVEETVVRDKVCS